MTGRRLDIQALRGLAVIAVMLYHASPSLVRGGYLGVDVFFVISGYLVTFMLIHEKTRGGWRTFFARRVARLLPATYCTLFFSLLLALFVLAPTQYTSFLRQMLAAIFFSENIFLWRETGYFDSQAQLKPLLHIWSLSLEEQFYFVLPFVILLLPRRHWWLLLLAGFLASLALCLALVPIKPVATFYLLPTRAWELLAGCLLCLLRLDNRLPASSLMALAGLAGLLFVILFPPSGDHPGIGAIAAVAGSAAIVAGGLRMDSPLARPLVLAGDWSYSLYLIHWPLLAFAANLYLSEPPWHVRLLCIASTFPLAYWQYRFVEQRFRYQQFQRPVKVAAAIAIPVLLMLIAGVGKLTADVLSRSTDLAFRQPNWGFGQECDYVNQEFIPKPACGNVAHPTVAIWGDSFAMHYVPGLLASDLKSSLLQVTRSSCPPILSPSLEREGSLGRACLRFNVAALDFLKHSTSIRHVILGSTFTYPFRPAISDKMFLESLQNSIDQLRQAGKHVTIIAPTPRANFDVGECLERVRTSKPVLNHERCEIGEVDLDPAYVDAMRMLSRLEAQADVAVLRPADLLCGTRCVTVMDGTLMYRDEGHLSVNGSRVFARRFGLSAKIAEGSLAERARPQSSGRR